MDPQGPRWEPVDPQELSIAEVVAYVRARCPWAAAHTHTTLAPYLLEETYELLAALASYDADPSEAGRTELIAELGDVAYQVLFHAALLDAPESTASMTDPPSGQYHRPVAIAEVLAGLHAKVTRRHPHVFESTHPVGIAEVERRYEEIKAAERATSDEANSSGGGADKTPTKASSELERSFASVPHIMPALGRAHTILSRAQRAGVEPATVLEHPGWAADENSTGSLDTDRAADRIGAQLLDIVEKARALGVDPEAALHTATTRFTHRAVATASPPDVAQ